MMVFTFAIFFAFNFSLWFMLPALLLRNITKPGRKKKDKNIKLDYVVYTALSVLYGLSYLMFYNAFDAAINEAVSSSTVINYFMDNIGNLTFVMILFLITSLIHGIFTFNLSRKLFRLDKVNYGYVIISITGLLNIITYFISNSILKMYCTIKGSSMLIDNAIKLLMWYNAKCVVEATRVGVITYFKEKNKLNLLLKRPRATIAN